MNETRWFSEDTDVDKLKRQLGQKDIRYANLQSDLDGKVHELEEVKLNLKEAQYKLQLEADRAIKLEASLEKKSSDFQRERLTRQNLETSVEVAQSKQKDTERSLRQVQLELDNYSLHTSGTSEQVVLLTKERDGLRNKIREFESSRRNATVDLEMQLADLRAQNEQLMKQLSGLTNLSLFDLNTPSRHRSHVPVTPARIPAGRPRASSTSADLRTAMEMELEDLRKAKSEATAAANAAELKLKKAAEELLAMENAKMAAESSATRETDRLKDELEDRILDIEYLQRQLEQEEQDRGAEGRQEIDRLRQEVAVLEQSLAEKQALLQNAAATPVDLSRSTSDRDSGGLQRQLSDALQENEALQIELERMDEIVANDEAEIQALRDAAGPSIAEWDDLQERLKQALIEVERLRQDPGVAGAPSIEAAETAERAMNKALQELELAREDARKTYAELELLKSERCSPSVLDTLKQALADATEGRHAKAAEVEELQDAISAAQAEIEALEITNQRLEGELEVVRAAPLPQITPAIDLLENSLPTTTPVKAVTISLNSPAPANFSFSMDDLTTSRSRLLASSASTLRKSRRSSMGGFNPEKIALILSAVDRLRAERDDLRERLHFMELEARFHATPGEVERDIKIQQLQIALLEVDSPMVGPQDDLSELRGQIEDLTHELASRGDDLDEAEVFSETLQGRLSELLATVQRTEAERDNFRNQLAEAERTVKSLRQDLEGAERQYQTLRKVEEVEQAPEDKMKADIEVLEQRIVRRTTQIAQHQHDMKRLEMNLRIAEDMVEELSSELETCQGEKACLMEDSEAARKERDEANRRCEMAEDGREELEERLSIATKQLEEARTVGESIELAVMVELALRGTAHIRSLEQRLQDLTENNSCDHGHLAAELDSTKAAVSSHLEQINRLENANAHLSESLDNALEEGRQLTMDLRAEQGRSGDWSDMLADNERLRQTVADLHTSIDGHVCPTDELEDLRSRFEDQAQQWSAERSSTQLHIAELRGELEPLRKTLAEEKARGVDLRRAYDDLVADHAELTDCLRQSEESLASVRAAERELEAVQSTQDQELAGLRMDVQESKHNVNRLEGQIKEMQEAQKLSEQSFEQDRARRERDVEDLDEALVHKTNELEALREVYDLEMQSAEKLAAELRVENSTLVVKLNGLQEDLTLLKESHARESRRIQRELGESLRKRTAEAQDAMKSAASLQTRVDELQQQLASAPTGGQQGLVQELTEKLEEAELRYKQMIDASEETDDRLLELMKDQKKLRAKLARMERLEAQAKQAAESSARPITSSTSVPSELPSTSASSANAIRPRSSPAPAVEPTSENVPPAPTSQETRNALARSAGQRLLNIPPARKVNPLGGLRLPPGSQLRAHTGPRQVLRALPAQSRVTSQSSAGTAETAVDRPLALPLGGSSKKRVREDDMPTTPLPPTPIIAESTPNPLSVRSRRTQLVRSSGAGAFTPTRAGVRDLVAQLESHSGSSSPKRPKIAAPAMADSAPDLPPLLPTMRPILNFRPRSPGAMRTRLDRFTERHPPE